MSEATISEILVVISLALNVPVFVGNVIWAVRRSRDRVNQPMVKSWERVISQPARLLQLDEASTSKTDPWRGES